MSTVNYNDERFQQVEADKNQALTELEKTYSGMVEQSDAYYQAQIDASKEYADKQTALQQQQTDFAIDKIEQEKDKANKDYTKEQSASYVDWQKQSNQYGANAEIMAAQGLANTGYSESSQVSMYNTYQNRVATAREVYNTAVLNYNNAIKDAQLQNSAKLAEIAYQALQQQLELSLEGFQYKNSLLLEQANKKTELDQIYYNRYQDVLEQINYENAQAEAIRQFNEQMAMQASQFEANQALERERLAQQRALSEAQLAEDARQADAKLAEEQRQFDITNAQKAQGTASGGGTGSGGLTLDAPVVDNSGSTYAVDTRYYQGDLNSDANKYGTFSNGYQPKGISGFGEVSKTGGTVQVTAQTLTGQTVVKTQNVWETKDGTQWYWSGTDNQYKILSAEPNPGGGNMSAKTISAR